MRARNLSEQLSQEYDKAVLKIQDFERELSQYRKENHELKRNIQLIIEKTQYEKNYR